MAGAPRGTLSQNQQVGKKNHPATDGWKGHIIIRRGKRGAELRQVHAGMLARLTPSTVASTVDLPHRLGRHFRERADD